MLNIISHPIAQLKGQISIPGDKSISHRSIMLAAIADGVSHVKGFLEGEDCLATLAAFSAMGVEIERPHPGELIIHGVGRHGLQALNQPLYVGNSGTSMRLLAGLLAAQSFDTTITGDASLLKRPMARVVHPLQQMGAKIDMSATHTAPLSIHGGQRLEAIDYALPVASAQVKSCLLLAGLYASGELRISEPQASRDHTERLFKAMGVNISRQANHLTMLGGQNLRAQTIAVPGDISSAAFFMVAASILPDADIIIQHVGVNPTRNGCIAILQAMGANIELLNPREICGEPIADLRIRSATLHGINIPEQLVANAIDEFPVLFIAASMAKGVTVLRHAKELRVKESDRIQSMYEGLTTLGIPCQALEDGIIIEGGAFQGGTVNSFTDHRIAMAFCIAGLVAKAPVTIQDCENVNTSFPNFVELLNRLGAKTHLDKQKESES